MVNLTQEPGPLTLSRNQIVYKFLATDVFGNIYGPKPASAQLTAGDTGYPDGSTVTITINNIDGVSHSVQFFAVTNPGTPNQILAATGTIDISYYDTVAAKIQQHPEIGPFLVMSTDDDDPFFNLIATGINTSDNFSVSFAQTGISGATTVETAAVPDNTPTNYRIIVEVFVETADSTYDSIAIVEAIPDADGMAVFDFAEDIHKAIVGTLATPPLPSVDNVDVIKSDVIRQHLVRYREDYDGVTPSWTVAGYKRTLCGGIEKQLFADAGFFSSFGADNSILSWYPSGKTVSLDQPEYLPYYNYHDTIKSIYLEVVLVDEDGNTTTVDKFYTPTIFADPESIYLIPVGYNQLELSNEGVAVKKYIVRVAEKPETPTPDPPTYFSQARIYYVDDNYYHDKRYITYLNSFCLPETLRCLGVQDKTLNIERQISDNILPVEYQALESETQQHDHLYQNEYTYRSGYLSKAEVDALQELLIYNNTYEIIDGDYRALLLTTDKFNLYSSRQFLHSIEFRAVPRYKEKNYSNKNIPLGDAVAAGGWNTGDGFWWEENNKAYT